jgi:protein-S-isoprenylcysteine O-methyltransferase
MPPWWVPVLLLVALWLAEKPLWRRDAEQRRRPSAHDRGTMWVNTVLGFSGFIAALALLPWTRTVAVLRLPAAVAWAGLLVVVVGTALRLWAMATLGRFFTATLQVQPDQPVITRGPYRLVRHPSYLGGDVALLGAGLTCATWPSALLMVLPFLAAHVWRIPIEEQMMAQAHGERWETYRRRTWRMVPGVW